MSKNVEAFKENKLKGIRTVTFAAYSEILGGSPVRTGRFRSNWMISAGQRSTEKQNLVFNQSKKLGDPPDSTEQTKGLEEVAKLGDEQAIYITNNLPYAKRLEDGHSSQNQGFVARAERNMRKRLKALDSLVLEN